MARLSQKIIDKIENILMDNFQLLNQILIETGHWFIAETIAEQLEKLVENDNDLKLLKKTYGIKGNNASAIAIFAKSPLATEKFCLLKIKEIKHFLTNRISMEILSPITLSFLEHVDASTNAKVTITALKLDQNHLATTLSIHSDIHASDQVYPSTLLALKLSSWLTKFDNETVIRFADRKIEESMSIRLYCSEIDYALASAVIKDNNQKNKNFWELYAINFKKNNDKPDENLIKIVKRSIAETYKTAKSVKLSEKLAPMAKFKKEIDQTKYIEKVLQNQRAGLGSLLYLPTGFGKTFIILLATAQHYSALSPHMRKPYLVVLPKNVQNAWTSNIDYFKSQYEGSNIFADEVISYLSVKSSSEFHKRFNEMNSNKQQKPNYHLILITEIVLSNIIKEYLKPKSLIKETPLVTKLAPLLKNSGVLIGEKLVVGNNKQIWQEHINKTITFLCTPDQVFFLLTNQLSKLFYDRQKDLSAREIEQRLEIFFLEISNKEKFIKAIENKPLLKQLLKLCRLPELSVNQQNAENIFNHLNGYYRHQGIIECLKPKFNANSTPQEMINECMNLQLRNKETNSNLLEEIETLSKAQVEVQTKYENFLNFFGGVIADESQKLLVKDPSNNINCRDTLFEMSDHYLTKSSKGLHTNGLVIAASATPWPNELIELQLHLRFLAPKLMKDYIVLNDYLFKQWSLLEKCIETYADNANVSAAPQNSKLEEAINLSDHVKKYLFPWIKIFFKELIIYEKPSLSQGNAIHEKFLSITCTEKDKIIIAQNNKSKAKLKSKNPTKTLSEESIVLEVIRKFYSGLLKNIPGPSSPKMDESANEVVTSDLQDIKQYSNAVNQCLTIIRENPDKKIAFYIEEHDSVLKLQEILIDFYDTQLGIPNLEVGFFYLDKFVKNQKKDSTIKTFNTNRITNRNAFNNIFEFDDYVSFLQERFNDSKLKYVNPIKSFLNIVKPLFLFFKALIEENQEKNQQAFNEVYEAYLQNKSAKLKDDFVILNTLLGTLLEVYFKNKSNIEQIIPDVFVLLQKKGFSPEIQQFLAFMQLLIRFEKHSMTNIVYFTGDPNWLVEFAKFLPPNIQNSAQEPCYQFDQFRSFIDKNVQENNKVADNIFHAIQYSFLYYIHYMYLMRVFIFGISGISGMRIDADIMFMFSGAWTEGKLTQIKGRFGRSKGITPARPCVIYAPLSNSTFELLILKYYILKSLYDRFIIADASLSIVDICEPIFLSKQLFYYYKASKSFIDDNIRNKVEQLEEQIPGRYFTNTPLEKAKYIIPKELMQQLATFTKLITELSARLPTLTLDDTGIKASDDEQKPTEMEVDLPLADDAIIPFVPSAWDFHYSDLIKAYAIKQGWQEKVDQRGKENDAGEFLLALTRPLPDITIKNSWQPTNISEGSNEVAEDKFAEVELQPGLQLEILKKPPYISVSLAPVAGTITIEQTIFEKTFRKDSCYAIHRENGKLMRYSFKTQVNAFSIETTQSIETIYVELTMQSLLRDQIKHIVVKDLQLGAIQYVLYGYICGGHPQGHSHFFTYRQGKQGYYICDDLKGIQFISGQGPLPISNKAILFRFDRKDLFELTINLVPKELQNYDNNCFINAPFQLADSERLRQKIEELKKQLAETQAKIPNNNDTTSNSSKIQCPPSISFHSAATWTLQDQARLQKFCDKTKKQFILMVPSRAVAPDLSLLQFVEALLNSCDNDSQVLLLFGTNCVDAIELEARIKTNTEILGNLQLSTKIFIKEIPFLWFLKDKQEDKVPLGQMRNHCLKQAYDLWLRLLAEPCSLSKENIALMTADGDMQLTAQSFSRCHYKEFKRNPFTLLTFGYEILFNSHIVNGNATEVEQATTKFFVALANHISMNVNSRMIYLHSHSKRLGNYTGYPAEPLLCLMPALTTLLFQHMQQQFNKQTSVSYENVFGHWDIEGRKLLQYLKRLCDLSQFTLAIIPPDKESKNRPILCEYERFEKKSVPPNFRYLKQALTKQDLTIVMQRLVGQPQSSINFHFMVQNMAAFFEKNADMMRKYVSYFYAKNLLTLLNLGPNRIRKFIDWLLNYFQDRQKHASPDVKTLQLLNVNLNQLQHFIEYTFLKLFQLDTNLGMVLFTQLVQWLGNFVYQLQIWFADEFIGEKNDGVYQAMELPDDYPKRALEIATADEQEIDYQVLSTQLKKYLDTVFDYATFSENSNSKLQDLVQKFPELKVLGLDANGFSLYAITLYTDESLFRERNKILLQDIQESYMNQKCILINLVLDKGLFKLIFSQMRSQHYVTSNALELEHKYHAALTNTVIMQHCPQLKLIEYVQSKNKLDEISDDLLLEPSSKRPKNAAFEIIDLTFTQPPTVDSTSRSYSASNSSSSRSSAALFGNNQNILFAPFSSAVKLEQTQQKRTYPNQKGNNTKKAKSSKNESPDSQQSIQKFFRKTQ